MPPLIHIENPEEGSLYGAGIAVKGKISDPYSWNRDFGGIESITAVIEPSDAPIIIGERQQSIEIVGIAGVPVIRKRCECNRHFLFFLYLLLCKKSQRCQN